METNTKILLKNQFCSLKANMTHQVQLYIIFSLLGTSPGEKISWDNLFNKLRIMQKIILKISITFIDYICVTKCQFKIFYWVYKCYKFFWSKLKQCPKILNFFCFILNSNVSFFRPAKNIEWHRNYLTLDIREKNLSKFKSFKIIKTSAIIAIFFR